MKRLYALFVAAALCLPSIGAWAWWQSIQQVGISGATPFSITNTDFAADATTQTTYTWSSRAFAIGSADASRVVVVAVFSRQAGTVGVASSVSIGGSAATLVVSAVDTTIPTASATSTMEIYARAVPAGTTATVSVTYPSAMLRAGCVVFSVLGSNGVIPSGAAIAADNTSTNPTASITVPVGGGAIVSAALSGMTGATPTNYTQDVASAVGTSFMAAGHDTSHSGSTTYTITGTGGTVQQPAGAFAAWSP